MKTSKSVCLHLAVLFFATHVCGLHAEVAQPETHEIYSVEELQQIGSGVDGWDADDTYILMNDLDCGGYFFERAVIQVSFAGVFNGNGHVIRNMIIDGYGSGFSPEPLFEEPSAEDVPGNGLFITNTGVIKNLGMDDYVIMNAGEVVGGICAHNYGVIRRCFADGEITSLNPEIYNFRVGGLCGQSYGPEHPYGQSIVEDCYSSGQITLANFDLIGGLIGHSGAIVRRCYSTTTIEIEWSEDIGVRTLDIEDDDYGKGTLLGRQGGNAMTENCYCYLGAKPYGGAQPLSYEAMQLPQSFAGFDFAGIPEDGNEEIWTQSPASGLCPALSWQAQAAPSVPRFPCIVSQSEDQLVEFNNSAALGVTTAGNTPQAYQWFHGESEDTSSPIIGATESTLTTPPVMASSAYWVQVSNVYGTADSDTIKVFLLHRVYTINDLLKVGSGEDDWNANDGYMLMNDIDLTATNFNSAVIQPEFSGVFNGNGHLIIGMNIDGASSGLYLGLFAANYGVIENLGLEAFCITNAIEYVGSLCANNYGIIRCCYANGSIFGNEFSFNYTIGGLVGQSYGPEHADGQSLIEDCHTAGELHNGDDAEKIGGLIGHSGATVRRCYSTMRLSWNDTYEDTAAVIGSEGGNSFTEHCYCYYWAGFPGSALPLLNSGMTLRDSYAGFDFAGVPEDGAEEIWTMYAGHTPILSWQNAPGIVPPSYKPETMLSGEGLPGNPFIIADRADFEEFCGNAELIIGHYLMTADIDLTGTNLFPAAIDRVFLGNFNGNGHSIANVRLIGDGSQAFSGLFAENYGVIENLGVTAFHITNVVYRTGAICAENYGTVRRCYAGGDIFCNNNSYTIGSLCGKSYGPDHADGQSVIEDCYTTGNIFCGTSCEAVGGLIGHSGAIIRRCYSTTRIDQSERSEEIGALIGNEGGNSLTENSYCYYWAGAAGSAVPLTAAEMIAQSSYTGFDFFGVPGDGAEEIWDIATGHTPHLNWQSGTGVPALDYMPQTTLSGGGLPGNPFIIADRADFEEFCNNDVLYIGHYLMTADIDLSDTNYTDNVVHRDFYGTFDGGMKRLLNLNIDCMNNPYISLFQENYGVIENLGIVNFFITNAVHYTAALCAENYGILRRCYTVGEIYCDSPNNSFIGGLCAQSYGPWHPGGQSLIEDCYSKGEIIYGESNSIIGGMIGHSGALVRRCYSTIELNGPWGYDLGNLIGREGGNAITLDCYCSNVGQINGAAQPLALDEMFDQISFNGFDFAGTPDDGTDDIWQIIAGLTPYLNGQSLAEYAVFITTQPQSAFVAYGAPAAVTVEAQGDAPLFYQWFEGERGDTSTPLPGATDTTFEIASVTNFINCWVLVSNAVGNAFSLTAEISYYYSVYTTEDLAKIGSNTDRWFSDVNYKLMNDIDLSESYFNQALIYNDFYGRFDGNGHVIHNLLIDGIEGNSYLGLFRSNYGIIENLGLENYCISNATDYAGAICAANYGRIQRCYTAGTITANNYDFMSHIGGICGQSYGPNHADGQSVIEDCYTAGSIQCGELTFSTGGLVGHCGAYVRNCYSTVNITANGFTDGLGALVGSTGDNSDIQNCYTYYWSGPAWNAKVLTTDEMLLPQSYRGFDFTGNNEDGTDDTWAITQGYSPRLSWQSGNGSPVPDYTPVTTLTGSGTAIDPFIIGGLGDFKEFCENANLRIGHFRMTADVDLSGELFTESPINSGFYGDFDGNGHVIKNMFIYSMFNEEMFIPVYGLFAFNYGHIHDLGVDAYLIIAEMAYSIGGLASANMGLISRCYTSGTILGENGSEFVGGLVGQTFVEDNARLSVIENCYSTGHIIVDYGNDIGGFTGYSAGVIRRCYSTTRVTVEEEEYGEPMMLITGLYNERGGFIGTEYLDALTLDCYLYQWAGLPGSATPLDNTQMSRQSSYVGFDFNNTLLDGSADTWTISADSCPQLSWQSGSGSSVPEYTASTTLSGKGTSDDPFIIASFDDFAEFAENNRLTIGHYRLTTDIDLQDITFPSSVIDREFSGHFDGNNHIIANMEIDNLNSDAPLGLFSTLSGTVRNLGLQFFIISNNSGNGNPTGALCGICDDGDIINCQALCTINGSGSYEVGGICGAVYNGSLQRCRFMGFILGGEFVGGICGMLSESTLQSCFTDCLLDGSSIAYCAGGICGRAEFSTLRNSYSRGQVMNATLAAGLCGEQLGGEIRDCYSTGAAPYGLCASVSGAIVPLMNDTLGTTLSAETTEDDIIDSNDTGTVTSDFFIGESSSIVSSFWDIDSSGTTMSAGGTGKTTAQMQDVFTFTTVGWDFFNTWYMNGYPELIHSFNEDSFERWIATEWTFVHQREQNDTPADDNIPNLIKYACGLSATTAYSSSDLMTMSLDPLTGLFYIEYLESKLNQDVILEPVWCPTLDQPWSSDNITMDLLEETTEHKLWRASIPLGESGFMRLRAYLLQEMP
jgi:hypothetical protein